MAAAAQAKEYEEPKMTESREAFLAARAKEVSEAERQRRLDAECKTIDELIAGFDEVRRDCDQGLLELVDAGEVSAAAAAIIRSWWGVKPTALLPPPSEEPIGEPEPDGDLYRNGINPGADDTPPEPPQAPPTREAPPPYYEASKPVPRDHAAAPSPASDDLPPWFGGPAASPSVTILYARPYQNFWCGRAYCAGERGEIRVEDPSAVDPLLRSGCSRTPPG